MPPIHSLVKLFQKQETSDGSNPVNDLCDADEYFKSPASINATDLVTDGVGELIGCGGTGSGALM